VVQWALDKENKNIQLKKIFLVNDIRKILAKVGTYILKYFSSFSHFFRID